MTGITLSAAVRDINHAAICARLGRREQPWLMRWGVFVAAAGMIGLQLVLSMLEALRGGALPDGLFALPLIAFFIALILLTRWRRRRTWDAVRDTPVRRSELTYRLSPEGVTVTSSLTHAEMKWPAFLDVVDDAAGILLMTGRLEYLILPNASFADAAQRAEVLAQARAWLDAARD